LLETGGGLLKASWFFDGEDPFLVHNVDVITDLDLAALQNTHGNHDALATLAVRRRETSRYFLFDEPMQLCGWKNKRTHEKRIIVKGEKDLSEYAFSGIQMISPKIFPLVSEKGKFSLTDLYLRLCRENKIRGFVHNEGYWSDVGKPEELLKAGKR
jgi:N-acetyl-alpha-D-muramate 1-phosphate uridylyltransferase